MTGRAYRTLVVEDAAAVRTVRLNVPDRRNAIGPEMTSELLYALDDAMKAESVRVLVLTGTGKAFCAGGDFTHMTGAPGDEPTLPIRGDYADLLLAMTRAEKPIVARVNGAAMGGGLGLVAASTFAIAAADAQLGTPEVHVGLFPMMIMALLTRLVPRRRIVQMMVLGEKVNGAEAASMGLVNHAVAPEVLDTAVAELAATLAKGSPTAIRLGLRALADQDGKELDEALPMLRDRLTECLATEDAREGLTAFLAKRAPVWTGR